MNLLLVDDEMFAMQGILDSVNWNKIGIAFVYTADSMKRALEIIASNRIDILLCDMEMPNGTGADLVSYINENIDYSIVTIFLTAHSEFDFTSQAIRLRCFDYILKPARPNVIEEVVMRAIESITKQNLKDKYEEYGQLYVKKEIGNVEEDSNKGVVEQCVEYIKEHISEPLSVEKLAANYYISKDYLTRLFKKQLGQNPSSYIKEQRMFLAKELIETTDMSITLISARVGYENYSAFITSFKKYYGVTPRDYRD